MNKETSVNVWWTYNKNKKWTYIVSSIEILGFFVTTKLSLSWKIYLLRHRVRIYLEYIHRSRIGPHVFFFLMFWLHLTACGILILRPGIKLHFPQPPTTLEGRVLNTRLAGKLVCIYLVWLSTDIALQRWLPQFILPICPIPANIWHFPASNSGETNWCKCKIHCLFICISPIKLI